MSFWRKFSKVIFGFSIVICSIVVLVCTFYASSKDFWYGILTLFVGALIVIFVHAFFGVFLELCDNIAIIALKTEKDELNQVSKYRYNSTEGEESVQHTEHEDIFDTQATNSWFCLRCGENNEMSNNACCKCGKTRGL
ncbi:MAG: hypothetical protein IJZ95_01845 [Oscillospiraceae bacterium]|nr:hypothetical protein [Oscillospiraceae bacterium]